MKKVSLQKQKKIIKTISIFALFILTFFSCKNPVNSKQNTDTSDQQYFEITGTLSLDKNVYSVSSLSQNLADTKNQIARSTGTKVENVGEETLYSNLEISAGKVVAQGEDPVVVYGTVFDTKNFTLRLTAGRWTISAISDCLVDTADVEITLSPETPYTDSISIPMQPKMTPPGVYGTVELVFNDETNTIKSFIALDSYNHCVGKLNFTDVDGKNTATFYYNTTDGGIVSEPSPVGSGCHSISIYFYDKTYDYVDSNNPWPVYECKEYINVFDGLTTDTWLLSTSDTEQYHLRKRDGATNGEADFIITQECLDSYKQFVYEVSSPFELKEAFIRINELNSQIPDVENEPRPQFKVYLTNDIEYSTNNDNEFYQIDGNKYSAIPSLGKTQGVGHKLNLLVSGKNGLKTININRNDQSSANYYYGANIGSGDNYTFKDICICGANTQYSNGVYLGGAGSGDCNLKLEGKILIYDNTTNVYFSYYSYPKLHFAGELSKDSLIDVYVYYQGPSGHPEYNYQYPFTTGLATAGITDSESASKIFTNKNQGYNICVQEDGEAYLVAPSTGSISTKMYDNDLIIKAEIPSIEEHDLSFFDEENKRFVLYKGYSDSDYMGDWDKSQIKVTILKGEDDITSSVASNFSLSISDEYGENNPDGTIVSYSGSETITDYRYLYFYKGNGVPGKYILTADVVYEGKKYSASWDVLFYDIQLVLNKTNFLKNDANETLRTQLFFIDDKKTEITFDSAQTDADVQIENEFIKINGYGTQENNILGITKDGNSVSFPLTEITLLSQCILEDSYEVVTTATFNYPYSENKTLSITKTSYINIDDSIPIYVYNKTGVDDNETGTIDNPFLQIQDAISYIQSINDGVSTYSIVLLNDIEDISFDSGLFMDNDSTRGKSYLYFDPSKVTSERPLNIKIKPYKKLDSDGNQVKAKITYGGSSSYKSRFIYVDGNYNLTLENLDIEGWELGSGYNENFILDKYTGGAIYCNSANLTVNNCYFNGNKTVDNGKGSVIYTNGETTINNCKFEENGPTAIYTQGTENFTVNQIELNDNDANVFYFSNKNNAEIKITDCTIQSTKKESQNFQYSGVICIQYCTNVTLNGVQIKDTFYNGQNTSINLTAINVSQSKVDINNCYIKNNNAPTVESAICYGIFATSNSSITLNNSYIVRQREEDHSIGLDLNANVYLNGKFWTNGDIHLNDLTTSITIGNDLSLPTYEDDIKAVDSDISSTYISTNPTQYAKLTVNTATNSFGDGALHQVLNGELLTVANAVNNGLFAVQEEYTLNEKGKIKKD